MAAKTVRFKYRNLPLLMLQARESIFARFRPLLHRHGITEQQWRVMRALAEFGPMEPKDLCEACKILSPSLAGVLTRMDDLGFVKRTRFDNDQRRVRVALTPKSRALVARITPQVETVYAQIEAELGPAFSSNVFRTLDRIIAVLGTGAEPDADDA